MPTQEEIDKLVNENTSLAWYALRKMQHLPEVKRDPEWFISAAMLGLLSAARRYDSDKGKFSTYAVASARMSILNEVLDMRKSKHDWRRTKNIHEFDDWRTEDPPGDFESYGRLDELLECLTPAQRDLVEKYYGFKGPRMSRSAIGKERKCTGQWISAQLHHIHKILVKRAKLLDLTLEGDQVIRKEHQDV